ncbi:MAG: anti-sigma factor family protein [Pseudomonadota bacterium]|jgi:anti-sigma factor (TIGR02949 family)
MNDKDLNIDPQTNFLDFHDCKDVIAHLGDFVDREIPMAQRAAIENHLDECPDCCSFLASYKHVISSAAELREPAEPLPVGIQNRLRKALNERLGIELPFIA